MIEALGQAVAQQFNKSTDIKNLLTGGLFFQQAPQDQEGPYAVYYFIGSSPNEYMGGQENRIHETEVQVNIFSTADDGGIEVIELSRKWIEGFDWVKLPMTGWNVLKTAHVSQGPLSYVNEIWQNTINYEIWVEKE